MEAIGLITSGRSGSTIFMHHLMFHPDVFVTKPHPHENRTLQYWANVARALTRQGRLHAGPVSAKGIDQGNPYWLGQTGHPLLEETLRENDVEAIVRFCRDRARSYYDRLMKVEGKQARFVAEKCGLPHNLAPTWPTRKHIHLVRDPREVFASIIRFDSKRGYYGFGREEGMSEVEYAQRLGSMFDQRVGNTTDDPHEVVRVRYEDFMRDASAVLAKTFRALGIESGRDVVTGVIRQAQTSDRLLTDHRTSTHGVATWRDTLGDDVRDAVSEHLGPAARAWGYA